MLDQIYLRIKTIQCKVHLTKRPIILLEKELRLNNIIHILEISSFQLEHVISSFFDVGCILNISEDHLDRY